MKHFKRSAIYLLLIPIALTPLLWFIKHPNSLVNGLDTNYPLDPFVWFVRRLYMWNDSLNGGVHMNASVAGLFFHLLQYLPFKLGLSLLFTQRLTFIFWFGMTAFAALIFARTFLTKNKILQMFFVVLYSFNIYLFNTWENSKVANLALVIILPVSLSLIELCRQKRISIQVSFVLQIIITVICAGIGINPAYFASLIGGICIYFAVYLLKPNRAQLIKATVTILVGICVASAFWLIPLIDFLFFSSKVSTLEGIGFTNWVASLSQNTSFVNVLRLMGAWDWYVKDDVGVPIYIPYAVKYFNSLPFIVMSFVIPTFAFAALLLRNKLKQVERSLLLFYVLVGVFLSAGLHEPTGSIFSILLNKVPFFSFFRSPWYIFTPYTIIGLGGLSIFLFEYISTKFPKFIFYLVVIIITVGHLLYSYPLWTGKIFRPGREDTFYVTTPQYVFDFAKWFQSSDYKRVITYPDDQLEKFNWGYKGTDSFLGLLVDKEVYAPSFNYPNKYVETFLDTFYLNIKKGEISSAVNMLPAVGVDSVLLKKDASSLSPEVSSLFDNYRSTDHGPWKLVDIGSSSRISAIRNLYVTKMDPSMNSYLLGYLPESSVIVEKGDTQLSKFSKYFDTLELLQSKPETLKDKTIYKFDIAKEGAYKLIFEQMHDSDRTAALLLDNKVIVGNDSFGSAREFELFLSKGPHTVTTTYIIQTTRVPEEYINEVSLSQVDQTQQRITIPVTGFNPFVNYDFNFDFKYVYGDLPQIELIQSYEKAPLKVERIKLSKNQDWLPMHFNFIPVPLASKLEIILKIADSVDSKVSKSTLNNLNVSRIISNRLFIYEVPNEEKSSVNVVDTKVNPTDYKVHISGATNGYLLELKENYQNGWKIESSDYIGNPVHLQSNGMYNLWYIPVSDTKQDLHIFFEPQRIYLVSLAVTVMSAIVSLVYLFIRVIKKNEKK